MPESGDNFVPFPSWHAAQVAWVLLAFILISLLVAFPLNSRPQVTADCFEYLIAADSLLQGDGPRVPIIKYHVTPFGSVPFEGSRRPGWPLLLAGVRWLVGEPFVIIWLNVLLTALAAALAALTLSREFGTAAALAGALILIVHPQAVSTTIRPLAEPFFLLLAWSFLFCLGRNLRFSSPLMVTILVFIILTRVNGIWFVLALLGIYRGHGRKLLVIAIGACVLAALSNYGFTLMSRQGSMYESFAWESVRQTRFPDLAAIAALILERGWRILVALFRPGALGFLVLAIPLINKQFWRRPISRLILYFFLINTLVTMVSLPLSEDFRILWPGTALAGPVIAAAALRSWQLSPGRKRGLICMAICLALTGSWFRVWFGAIRAGMNPATVKWWHSPAAFADAASWIQRNTGDTDVIASYYPWPLTWQTGRQSVALPIEADTAAIATVLERWHVRFLVIDTARAQQCGLILSDAWDAAEPLPGLSLVWNNNLAPGRFRIFRVVAPGLP